MYRFIIRSLCLVLLSVSASHGQAECVPDYPEQCDEGFFCDDSYQCRRCAVCEHFRGAEACAQTNEDCGVCLEGYEFLGPGQCVARPSTVVFWVGAGCSTAILLAAVATAAVCYTRKRKNTYWTRCGPETLEDGRPISTAEITPLPPRPSAPPPPPYTAAGSQAETEFNSYYTGSSEPLLKHGRRVPELETEGHQMANPCSNYVRLPPDIHRYNMEEPINDEQGNRNPEDDNIAADDINNNIMALPRRAFAEPALSDTSGVSECNTLVESTDIGQDGGSRSGSPEGGSQQLIVQFINNISPVLNLQGNNTRR